MTERYVAYRAATVEDGLTLAAGRGGRRQRRQKKKPLAAAYFPHPVARAVSSALRRFTSVFGMGTGGSASLQPPGAIRTVSVGGPASARPPPPFPLLPGGVEVQPPTSNL